MINRSIAKFLLLSLILLACGQLVSSQELLRVMPLGNSITKGNMCTNGWVGTCVLNSDATAIGYRKVLLDSMVNAGYNVDFIGKYSSGGSLIDDPDHSGFAGIRDHELADIMETGYSSNPEFGTITPGPFMESFPAQLVLLHIGTNDIYNNDVNAWEVNNILDAIDDFETGYGIPVLVFVSRVISERNYPCGTHSKTNQYNNALYSYVQSRISSGDHLVWVDMECGAEIDYTSDMQDELHPKQTGYDKMGSYWFQAIHSYNQAPVISAIPDQVTERGTAFSTLSLDNFVSDDEDNDASISWTISPSSPQHFNITIDENRVVTIVAKDGAWSGSEEITFVATDQGKVLSQLKKSSSVTVNFTVEWMPEIIGQQEISTPEDTPLELTLDHVTIVEPEKAPGDIQLNILEGENYTFSGTTLTPAPDYSGPLSVTVTVSGNGKTSASYNLAVEVESRNDAPVIIGPAGELTMIQNTCLEILKSDLLVEDPDNTYPEGFSVRIQAGSNYTHSGARVCPEAVFTGTLDVGVRVFDGSAESETFILEIDVFALKPGFILPENREVEQDQVYNEVVSINHFDPASFSYTRTEIPAWMVFNTETGQLSGIPRNEDVGEHVLVFAISDGIYSTDTTFVISVINVNDPPEFITQSLDTAHSHRDYAFQVKVEDADEDVILFDLAEKPGWLQINSTSGLLSGYPLRSDIGTGNVRIRAWDGHVFTEKTFALEVIFYNNPPKFISDPDDTAYIGSTYTYGAEASDEENDPVTYFASKLPEWSEFHTHSQVMIGIPEIDNWGEDMTVLAVTDGMDTTYQSFIITVRNPLSVEDSPVRSTPPAKLYPNPFTSIVYLEMEPDAIQSEDWTFTLTDMSGRVVFEAPVRGMQTEFRVGDDLLPGVYMYRVTSRREAGRSTTGKIIKQDR